MTTTINASPTNGLIATGDGSGVIKLQSNGVTTNALAWVNFNGTGTVAIRSSYNVSSITDNGTGNYTVNFTTALSDANYSAVTGVESVGSTNTSVSQVGSYTTTSVSVFTVYSSTTSNRTLYDAAIVNVAIFGN